MYDEAFRTSMDDCNKDRCPLMVSIYYGNYDEQGQCHLRRGHKGMCDLSGTSHTEAGRSAMKFVTYESLRFGLRMAEDAYPNSVLVKNQVGNLAVMDGDSGEYVGFIDLVNGEFNNREE